MTNPNDFPIRVNGAFTFMQSGIGQVSGPIEQIEEVEIPANGEITVSVTWLPDVAGHYCLIFEYNWTAENGRSSGGGKTQRNLQALPSPFLKPQTKGSIRKATQLTNYMGDASFVLDVASSSGAGGATSLIHGTLVGNILSFIFEGGGGIDCALGGGTSCSGWKGPSFSTPFKGSLSEDPPSQDYETLYQAETLNWPDELPVEGTPAARTAAINELVDASELTLSNLVAANIALDRYAGAVEAKNLQWSSLQSAAYLYYVEESGRALLRLADAFDQLVAQIEAENLDVYIHVDDVIAYQQRLATSGFTAIELEAGRLSGLTDESIETIRLKRISADPNQLAGSQLQVWRDVADAYRELGNALLNTRSYDVGSTVGGSGRAESEIDLVAVYESSASIVVGNPTAEEATIDLRLRPVGLPWDWSASLSTNSVTLQPGEETTVRVNIAAGLAVPEGVTPSVAVEGFIDGELLSGVVIEVAVPFEGTFTPNVPTVVTLHALDTDPAQTHTLVFALIAVSMLLVMVNVVIRQDSRSEL